MFIDDLSFTKDDDDFGALKAILEGSVSARTSNLAVYATSNRRHLVRETFSDREGDEVHANDTVQQLVSLSDRFGLTITFSRPDKAQYLPSSPIWQSFTVLIWTNRSYTARRKSMPSNAAGVPRASPSNF